MFRRVMIVPFSIGRRVACRVSIHVALLCLIALLLVTHSASAETWAEKLGFPAGRRVLILHSDDIGMCYEANQAAKHYLNEGEIQSAALMVPCPWFNEMADWYKQHPDHDIGLHLTLTSEWKFYRWGPVAPRDQVPGLIDDEGYLWREVVPVVLRSSPKEVEAEIRAQIERALERGIRPSHIDTHMGTLYASPGFTEAYLRVAEEYRIPAMAIEPTPSMAAKFRKKGYPVSDRFFELLANYSLPKLDDFDAVPAGKTYEEKVKKFFEQIRLLEPGITELIFHPSVDTEGLHHITNSWQQRVWEARMFSDPQVKQFLEREQIIFTNWKEMMARFDARKEK